MSLIVQLRDVSHVDQVRNLAVIENVQDLDLDNRLLFRVDSVLVYVLHGKDLRVNLHLGALFRLVPHND